MAVAVPVPASPEVQYVSCTTGCPQCEAYDDARPSTWSGVNDERRKSTGI